MPNEIFPHKQSHRLRNSLVALAMLSLVFFGVLLYRTYEIYQSDLPSFEQLHNIEPSVNTKVYDRNGDIIDEFFSENRALTPFREFPPYLTGMLQASEDREFSTHWGLNIRRTAIVAVTNLVHWDIRAGASTVTQQVARMLFLTPEQTLSRKVKEALTAVKLERTYSKEEIMEMYLNQHYFSRGAYGVAAAARLFFDKSVAELDKNECATIIGLLKGPNINSPLNNIDKSLLARNRVLYSYFDVGGISREEYDSLSSEPIKLASPGEKAGTAPYFSEAVRQYLLEKYGEEVLYSGGLRVFTTLDSRLQEVAQSSIHRRIDSLRAQIERTYPVTNPNYSEFVPDTNGKPGDSIRVYKKVQGAFVAIDNANGDIIAMVGGRSFQESEFNRAVQALRQPGSSFKPFVYTACIDNGYHTTDIIDDNPIVLEIPGAKEWRPHNYDDKFLGPITLRDALRQSRNLVAIRLILKITPQEVIFYAKRLGITTPLAAVPSLAIGASEVKLIELVSAFSVYPNGGLHIPHRMVLKVIDRYGRVLEDNGAVQKEEVLSAQTSYIMTDMMRSVVDNGTARRARSMGFTRPAGGKTGTSDNFCDNWFVGFTPQFTAGTWVGFDDKTSLGSSEDGGRNAVPTWTDFMIAAHDSLPLIGFEEPVGIVHAYACLESGEVATDKCMNVGYEVFTLDNQPNKTCSLHPSSRRYVPRDEPRVVESLDSTEERTRF
ncbi:MAG: PBP1A family penicillin-binding protein [candidate division Zixibacteria bacterium]|nr:PBP1A family penicillin-binding protein [candidate division Zixibacteria bacterium]